jgi:hypothetical protein
VDTCCERFLPSSENPLPARTVVTVGTARRKGGPAECASSEHSDRKEQVKIDYPHFERSGKRSTLLLRPMFDFRQIHDRNAITHQALKLPRDGLASAMIYGQEKLRQSPSR